MKNPIIIFLVFIFFLSPTFGQYSASNGLLTINTGSGGSGGNNSYHKQDNSVGAIGPSTLDAASRPISYYAISSQYSSFNGNQCWRQIRFFTGQGTLIASSPAYSHDHSGKTKLIFDPNNGNVVYALYQERYNNVPLSNTNTIRTYVRRFQLNPVNNTITASSRFHVFNFKRSADFTIAANGDLLVGSIQPNGSVHIKAIRYNNGFTHLNTFVTSQAGEAYSNPLQGHTWSLSMDMKGNTVVIAHNKGSHFSRSIKIKKGAYIAPTVPNTGALPLIHQYNLGPFQSIHRPNLDLFQSVGIRPNGDVFYLVNKAISNNWELIKIDNDNHATTTIRTGSGNAHLVVSENNMVFLARRINNSYKLEIFNDHDVLEHTYNTAWQIDQGIKNLATRDCQILSCGREQTYTQFHQLYTCSDCNGGPSITSAEMVNQEENISAPSFYGPQQVAVYCKWSDVTIDASGSSCDNSVYLAVTEINLATWATQPNIFGGWICTNCTAGANIKPVDYVTPPTGYQSPSKYYLATIVAGPDWNPVYKLFKFKYCKADPIDHKGDDKKRFGKITNTNTSTNTSFIYPNPTTGVVNIQIDDIRNNSDVQVFNTLGQMILQTQTKGQENLSLDLSNYDSGLYIIQITTGDEKRLEKVIKQ